MSTRKTTSSLGAEDLIRDEPLQNLVSGKSIRPSDDLLQHGVLAAEVAELALTSDGRLNIAVFGPWGAGKSSFFGLLKQEIEARTNSRKIVTFNAWENAGKEFFHVNFLSAIAGAGSEVDRKLYQSTRTVKLPTLNTSRGWKWLLALVTLFTALLLAFPLIATSIQALGGAPDFNFGGAFVANVPAFFAIPVGGTLLAAVITLLVDLGKVTVEESAPSHVAEFKRIFAEQVGRKRHIIFIDELDRCGPEDVMLTLEGLRTFLDHPRCVFVVAFDRDAVSATIAANSRSARSERSPAYYRTSGEYLDKVFQFQVSLPPQQGHVTRGFARKLVADRGGVWKTLRDSGPDVLDRVVSILSPIHVMSPRRTKVLLNDFAVNARTYQDLGFDWIVRAEEIAVLSVIKTEFPYFADDLEREPMLLEYLATNGEPTRPALKRLKDAYRILMSEPDREGADEGRVLEDVVSTIGDARDTSSGAGVNRALAQQLDRYLEKLQDESYGLPKADIILMRNDPDLGGFEDGALHATLLLAGEAGREETVQIVQQASEADQGRAIAYLLRRIEGSPSSDWTIGLLNIALEVVHTAPAIPAAAARGLLRRWESSNSRADLADRLTAGALKGITRLTVDEQSRSAAIGLLKRALAVGEEAVTTVTEELLARQTSEQLADCANVLLDLVCHRQLDPEVARQALSRICVETTMGFNDEQVERMAAAYSSPDDPADASAVSTNRANSAERQAQMLASRDAYDARACDDFTRLVSEWITLPHGSKIRSSLLQVLRLVDSDSTWALDLHDQLLTRDDNELSSIVAGDEALEAIADEPELAEERWLKFLPTTSILDVAKAGSTVASVAEWAIEVPDDDSRLDGASEVITAVRSASATPITDGRSIAVTAKGILPTETKAFAESAVRSRVALIDALDGVIAVDANALWASLVLWALSAARNEPAAAYVIGLLDEAHDDRLDVLTATLESERAQHDLTDFGLRALIRAQLRQVARGKSIEHLSWNELNSTVSVAALEPLAREWLRTGPPADELDAASESISLSSFGDEDWSEWTNITTPRDRARLWRLGRESELTDATLAKIVEAGPSADLYDEIAAPLTSGASVEARLGALRDFGTLPLTAEKARVAVAALETLSARARGVDAPLAHNIAATVASVLTSAQRSKARTALATWAHARIADSNRVALEAAGLVEPKNPVVRFLRRGRSK